MILKEKNSVKWLEFEIFQEFPKIRHAVFLKHGGYSEGEFKSLNLSYVVGDERENVSQNFEKIKKIMGIDKVYKPHLEHGNCVCEPSSKTMNADAITTSSSNTPLFITHADCQAAIFYDPINHAIANVHCGWRGNVLDIYEKTIEAMKFKYGTSPKNLLVGISPSLGPDKGEFVNFRKELPELFWQYQIKPNYFDFWAISRDQLENCGVLSHHIEIAQICTYTNKNDYFSYRRSKLTGRGGTIIWIIDNFNR